MMKAFQQAPAASSPRNFITHIGGLRGLAILFIVIYHLGKGWVPCGQFGVDIFFVISGFFLFAGIEKPVRKTASACWASISANSTAYCRPCWFCWPFSP